MNLFDLAQECSSYSEYKMKAEIYGLKPEVEEVYEANRKGILYCPYIPIQISKVLSPKSMNNSKARTTCGKLIPGFEFERFATEMQKLQESSLSVQHNNDSSQTS